MKQNKLRKEIFEKAHLEESSELARTYFKVCGLEMKKVTIPQCEKLSELITNEIELLLVDKTYQMIKRLSMNKHIYFGSSCIYFYTNGFYFKRRQAISFYFERNFIGFCSWASGCNRIPYIKGFIKWCDYLQKQKAEQIIPESEVFKEWN